MITIRRARPEDVHSIVDLANRVFRPSTEGMAQSMGLQFPLFLSERNARNLFIAEDDGRIVAHNGIMPNTLVINGHQVSMASMGSVCTDPEYQGRGIGTRILHTVLDSLREEGTGLLTISGGRGLYTRNGASYTAGKTDFTIAKSSDDAHVLEAYSGASRALSIAYHQDEIAEIIGDMVELYQSEPVRYMRAGWEFATLIKASPIAHDVSYPPKTIVASCRIGDHLAAYLVGYVRREEEYHVVEYAGDRMLVAFLLHQVHHDLSIDRVAVTVPSFDRSLTSCLEAYGHHSEAGPYPSTFVVTNATALWDQIYPIIKERVCDPDTPLTPDQLPVHLDDSSGMLHFLFDAHQRKEYGQPWDSILPVPLPYTNGLNYI